MGRREDEEEEEEEKGLCEEDGWLKGLCPAMPPAPTVPEEAREPREEEEEEEEEEDDDDEEEDEEDEDEGIRPGALPPGVRTTEDEGFTGVTGKAATGLASEEADAGEEEGTPADDKEDKEPSETGPPR